MAASGLTFVQIVNRVLRRLREDEVTNYNDNAYSTMISDLVNQVKTEIEESWQWHALRDTFQIVTTNNTSQYALTGAGPRATVLDAWNTTQGYEVVQGTVRGFNFHFFGVGSSGVATGRPTEYIQAGVDSSYDVVVDVWPVPVTGQLDTLKLNAYVPQDDLAANATVPLVPQNVLIEEVIARALAERGEEGAQQPQPGGDTFIRRDLLARAVMDDIAVDRTEADWEPE
jgi:hypothetical protein